MNSWEHEPEFLPETMQIIQPVPNIVERIVRVVLHVVGTVALILASVLMLTLIRFGLNVGNAVDRFNTPDPAVTGCPFGDGECGG